jgi:hypothetical protein
MIHQLLKFLYLDTLEKMIEFLLISNSKRKLKRMKARRKKRRKRRKRRRRLMMGKVKRSHPLLHWMRKFNLLINLWKLMLVLQILKKK